MIGVRNGILVRGGMGFVETARVIERSVENALVASSRPSRVERVAGLGNGAFIKQPSTSAPRRRIGCTVADRLDFGISQGVEPVADSRKVVLQQFAIRLPVQ